MAKVKFFTRSKSKDQHPIRVRFSYTEKVEDKSISKSLFSKLPETVPPSYWNNDSGKPVKSVYFKNYEYLSNTLETISRAIIDSFKTTDEVSTEWLKETIDKFYHPEKHRLDITLFGYIEKFINNANKRINDKTGNPVSYKVKREYHVTFNYLKKFCNEKCKGRELDFIDMDKEFKENFSEFLREKELHHNTIVRKITTLKIFLNDAKYEGKNPYDKYLGWKVKKIETDSIYLNENELNMLYNHDFNDNKRLEKVRDMFIVGSYTGLRFGELTSITKDNINNDKIYVKQPKTENRVVIPLHPIVKKILNKYDGNLPEIISNQKYNDYIKEACQEAEIKTLAPFKSPVKDEETGKIVLKHLPKYKLASSHTARRSFATNMYLAGMETLHIRSITGHKTETAFLKYIKVSPEQHAEKIREFWQKQGEFIKVENNG